MTHFGVIAPPFYSHFSALQAVAGELVARGHRVTFFHQPDAHAYLTHPQVSFQAVGQDTHPSGTLAATLQRAAAPGSPWGLRRVIIDMAGTTEMLCRTLPAALRAAGVQALLCDQMEAAGGLVAEHLGLPFISVACALPVNREPAIPLPVMPFGYDASANGLKRVEGSTRVYDALMAPLKRAVARQAAALDLPARVGMHECLSPLAQISQTVAAFDFPRTQLPPHFHAVGPLRPVNAAAAVGTGLPPAEVSEVHAVEHAIPSRPDGGMAQPQSLPDWAGHARPDRPFIFASLGTLQGHRFGLFKRIARAARMLDAQLLIAHCGGLNAEQSAVLRRLGATWVTDFADQPAALARADVVISHGGLNTVMDAIAAHTPILALPIAFDQPGVAARICHAGIGRRAWPQLAGARQIANALRTLLADPSLPAALQAQSAALAQAGGTRRAVDIIEDVLGFGRAGYLEQA